MTSGLPIRCLNHTLIGILGHGVVDICHVILISIPLAQNSIFGKTLLQVQYYDN